MSSVFPGSATQKEDLDNSDSKLSRKRGIYEKRTQYKINAVNELSINGKACI